MKNRLKFLPLCLLLAFAVVPVLKAQSDDAAAKPARERGPGGGGRGPNAAKLAEDLGLSAEQKEKVAAIIKHQEEQMKALSPDERREKGRALREEGRKAIEALLTPEQAKKFAEMRPNGPRGDRQKGEKKGDKGEKDEKSDK